MAFARGPKAVKASTDGYAAVTSSIDTTGMTLIVIVTVQSNRFSPGQPSDSAGNTWLSGSGPFEVGWLNGFAPDADFDPFYTMGVRAWYCVNPTTSATHTFTVSRDVQEFPLLFVLTYSGVSQHTEGGIQWPFDYIGGDLTPITSSHVTGTHGSTGFTTVQPDASFTPTQDSCLVISALGLYQCSTGNISVDAGTIQNSSLVTSTALGGAVADTIQTTAAAVQPTWTYATNDWGIAASFVFRSDGTPAGNGTGPGTATDGPQAINRQRCWSFVMDGHTFYVLNLGEEGTFVYDITTGQWSEFITTGFVQWDVINGCMWGQRVVGGALLTTQVWEMSPDELQDEDGTDIAHLATGGMQTRSRDKKSISALRLTGAVGTLGTGTTATVSMRYSDDNGETWSAAQTVTLTEGTYDTDLSYRALGSVARPGRIFEISDTGGPVRLDGADVEIEGENDNIAG